MIKYGRVIGAREISFPSMYGGTKSVTVQLVEADDGRTHALAPMQAAAGAAAGETVVLEYRSFHGNTRGAAWFARRETGGSK